MQPKEEMFQTPLPVVQYMIGLIPVGVASVLEPTPGLRGIVNALENKGYQVTAPEDYFLLQKTSRFDAIVMNPPFSAKTARLENAASYYSAKGMRVGYEILMECTQMSDNVIAVMPWFTLIDSDGRMSTLKQFGIKSITHLPRKTFHYSRIQCCVLELSKGFSGETCFKTFKY